MPLDQSGTTLGLLIANALGLPDPPVNPTPAQQASYLAAKAAQIENWTIVSQTILTYIASNAIVTSTVTTTDTVPALGLISPGGLTPAPVTGLATGTGSGTGTGTIS